MVPFFKIFGSKWQLAADLGPPQHDHVIEPFAGGAGYSTRWEPKRVTLIERDPVIAGAWSYLIKATPEEILRLPVQVNEIAELENNRKVPEEARNLIGFWLNSGVAQPAKRRSQWARWPCLAASYWGRTVRLQIASQVPKIKHWRIIEGSWENAPDAVAHIDPELSDAALTMMHKNMHAEVLPAEKCLN